MVITISTDTASAAAVRQFVLSLLGLAVLLSLAVYITTRRFSQRLASKLGSLAQSIALEDQAAGQPPRNEWNCSRET